MSTGIAETRDVLGRPIARLALLASAAGGLGLGAGMLLDTRGTVLAALAASWLFFAGAAAGAVGIGAAIRLAGGRWAGQLLPAADAGAGFFVPAWILLLVLEVAARLWHPGVRDASLGHWAAVAGRDLLGGAALFAVGKRWVRTAKLPWAVVYLLLYATVLSLWAVDLVMDLEKGAPNTAVPAYYFIGAWVSGLAWVTLVSCLDRRGALAPDARHDVGKLLFGMTTFLGYLLWSIFLPTWYANLPEETAALLVRWQGPYRTLTTAVVLAVFLLPFVLLITEQAKRNRAILALGAGLVAAGLWAERFLLVLPGVHPSHAIAPLVASGCAAVGVAGVFTLRYCARLGRTGA